jgi:hypothetical protein
MVINGNVERIWSDVTVAHIKIIFRHLSVRTEEKHENLPGEPVFG